MRAIGFGVTGLVAALVGFAAACGGSDDDKGSGGGAGSTTGGQSPTAGSSSGGNGGSSQGGGGGTGVNPQGGGAQGPAECKVLHDGETGAHGFKQVYHSDTFGAFYSPLGIEGDQVYFSSGGKVMSYPVAGAVGTAKELGDVIGTRQLVHGGKLYAFHAGADGKMGSMVSAPLTDLATVTTLAESIAEPQQFVADDAALYFDRREPTSSIFKLAITGGTPEEIVPGGSPLGMISHAGNLYWLDFESGQLERVPVAGGARQKLAEVFFGGPMAAQGNAVYWADTSLNTIEKWEEGAKMTQNLNTANSPFDSPENLAVDGNDVYWVLGFTCGEVHQVHADGSGSALFAQGSDSADWVGVAPGALFVLGRSGLYRADR
jgi:hypothetical protein